MGFDEISVTLPTFNGIAIRSVSGRHFGKLADSNVSVGVLQGYSPIASSLQESFPGAVRYRLPPPLPTSRATPEKLSQPSVTPDDSTPCQGQYRHSSGEFGQIESGYRQAIDFYRIRDRKTRQVRGMVRSETAVRAANKKGLTNLGLVGHQKPSLLS